MTNTPGSQRVGGSRRPVIIAVVMALVLILVGLLGVELYARHRAGSLVADAVRCEAQDTAEVSFATSPPVLLQYLSHHYPDISVRTAGNQIRDAKGMRIDLDIHDIRLQSGADSNGTIGALSGTITWSSDGIKQSIQDAIPMLGDFITSHVSTNPGDGTVELAGMLDKATLKPQVVENGLSLQIVSLSALGHQLDTSTVQQELDALTSKATKDYPLGIHADTVQVTDAGVVAAFSSQNADIPSGGSNPCFAKL